MGVRKTERREDQVLGVVAGALPRVVLHRVGERPLAGVAEQVVLEVPVLTATHLCPTNSLVQLRLQVRPSVVLQPQKQSNPSEERERERERERD